MQSWSAMPKQRNGTHGKKPPAPSVKTRPARTLLSKERAVRRLSQQSSANGISARIPIRRQPAAVLSLFRRVAAGIKPQVSPSVLRHQLACCNALTSANSDFAFRLRCTLRRCGDTPRLSRGNAPLDTIHSTLPPKAARRAAATELLALGHGARLYRLPAVDYSARPGSRLRSVSVLIPILPVAQLVYTVTPHRRDGTSA